MTDDMNSLPSIPENTSLVKISPSEQWIFLRSWETRESLLRVIQNPERFFDALIAKNSVSGVLKILNDWIEIIQSWSSLPREKQLQTIALTTSFRKLFSDIAEENEDPKIIMSKIYNLMYDDSPDVLSLKRINDREGKSPYAIHPADYIDFDSPRVILGIFIGSYNHDHLGTARRYYQIVTDNDRNKNKLYNNIRNNFFHKFDSFSTKSFDDSQITRSGAQKSFDSASEALGKAKVLWDPARIQQAQKCYDNAQLILNDIKQDVKIEAVRLARLQNCVKNIYL